MPNPAGCQERKARVRALEMRAGRHKLAAAAQLFALLAGCSEPASHAPAEPSEQALVSYDGWRALSPEDDPFVTDVQAVPSCLSSGLRAEADTGWAELDTSQCGWITLRASALTAVTREQVLRLVVSHYDLEAPEPAEARLELRFGDCEVWSKSIPIPSPAAVYPEQLSSPCDLAADGPVLFHLNNHGQNTWQLQALTLVE